MGTSAVQVKLVVNFATNLARCTYLASLEQSSIHAATIGTEIIGIPLWRPVLDIQPPQLIEWAILTWSYDQPTQIHRLDQATAIYSFSTGLFPRRQLRSWLLEEALMIGEFSTISVIQSLLLWLSVKLEASHQLWKSDLEGLFQDAQDALVALQA